ncbi:hypothetical protein [Haloarchaeobius salinus]|uniref:hypothetical protein n=1 Tax=Haloarchaeobius salinus TaxID=1198298 RepID=UPI00210D4375|nr:hypothetical protein [Haloarchaeobius salinus]
MTDQRTPGPIVVAIFATALLAFALGAFGLLNAPTLIQSVPLFIVALLLLGLARVTAHGRPAGRVALLLVLVPIVGLSTFGAAVTGDPTFLVGTGLGGVAFVSLARSGGQFES